MDKTKYEEYRKIWLAEEEKTFSGWDFSCLSGRCESDPLPWDYREIVSRYRKDTDTLLDMGTGGGEMLLSLGHPYDRTTVTEGYPPNVELCRRKLEPLGVTVVQNGEDDPLPFEDESFDIILNRHASFDLAEIHRVLRDGGVFLTQQVGGRNNFDLSSKLLQDYQPKYEGHELAKYTILAHALGFGVEEGDESYGSMRLYDVGALVYYARIIQWEFPEFSVERCFDQLCACQEEIEKKGFVSGTEHRFMLVLRKM